MFYYIVTYSYLVLPLTFLLLKSKFKERIPALLAIYGIVFFALLLISYEYIVYNLSIPKAYRGYYQIFYTYLEYLVFTFIFWSNIRNNGFKKFIVVVSASFFIFLIFFATTASIKRLDSVPVSIETILVFIFIFYFFYEFSKNSKDIFIYNHFCFWMAVGILIYLGGSFFFYILINNLEDNEVDKFGNITYVAEIIKNVLFAFSIFIYRKFPTSKLYSHPKKIPNLDMI